MSQLYKKANLTSRYVILRKTRYKTDFWKTSNIDQYNYNIIQGSKCVDVILFN